VLTIAYDHQIFCLQAHGGISRYFCEIATRIQKHPDVEVSIVSPFYSNAHTTHLPMGLVRGFDISNFRFHRFSARALSGIIAKGVLYSKPPNIVHETYYSGRRSGPTSARHVLTIYDMIHEKFPSSFSAKDNTAKKKALAAARADHVICISESTRCDAIEILGLSSEKITVIHLGFELAPSKHRLILNNPMLVDDPYLLYVGNRGGYKNFSRLLKAFSISTSLKANHKLVCFGGGCLCPDELRLIRSLGLSCNKVLQLGGNDDVLSSLYSGARALIYPSLYEGFGIPPLEAMSYDCPVICSNAGSIPEVVGDAGEYFDPYNVDSIRLAIERVTESTDRGSELIENGRERLRSFSWNRCATETLQVYNKIL
jgi:glycosyltransferase involved in cell wall biosynthesis